MKTTYYFFSVIIALGLTACGGSKQMVQAPQGNVEVIVPCSGPEYRSNNEYFRSYGTSASTDQSTARKMALSNARSELAAQINATVKRVVDDYTSSYQSGEMEETKRRYQDMARTAVNEKLAGTRVICEKMMQTPAGKYEAYIAIELGGEEIAKAMNNRINGDEKLRIDFEYEKFKKVFDEEMGKTEEN